MKVTIEHINGKQYTVIWNTNIMCGAGGDTRYLQDGSIVLHNPFNRSHHIATALPPLPRHPKPKDVPLLHRYMAYGIAPVLHDDTALDILGFTREGYLSRNNKNSPCGEWVNGAVITYCTQNGKRVEVAIEGVV